MAPIQLAREIMMKYVELRRLYAKRAEVDRQCEEMSQANREAIRQLHALTDGKAVVVDSSVVVPDRDGFATIHNLVS